jgi:hypothetical protein
MGKEFQKRKSFTGHHLCTYTMEPSRDRSCSVASGRRCRLHSALLLTARPESRSQPLDDEVLE